MEQEKTKSGNVTGRPGLWPSVSGKERESMRASALTAVRVTEFSGNMEQESLAQPGPGGSKQLEQEREWREVQRGAEQGMWW